jgi:excisionase family DNA binding protein
LKAELTLPAELVDLIADKVIERLKPIIAGNGKHEDNIIFNKKSLSEYLNVSESTINKLVSNKQIPHFKIQPGQSGGVRFSKRDIDKWISRHTIPEINHYIGKMIKAVS